MGLLMRDDRRWDLNDLMYAYDLMALHEIGMGIWDYEEIMYGLLHDGHAMQYDVR